MTTPAPAPALRKGPWLSQTCPRCNRQATDRVGRLKGGMAVAQYRCRNGHQWTTEFIPEEH